MINPNNNIKCNILDRHPSDTKNLVLMKLRRPDTQSQLSYRIESFFLS